MAKALCLLSLVVSIFVVSCFLLDAIALLAGFQALAILGGASLLMDLTFVVLGGIMILLSWLTYKEQR